MGIKLGGLASAPIFLFLSSQLVVAMGAGASILKWDWVGVECDGGLYGYVAWGHYDEFPAESTTSESEAHYQDAFEGLW